MAEENSSTASEVQANRSGVLESGDSGDSAEDPTTAATPSAENTADESGQAFEASVSNSAGDSSPELAEAAPAESSKEDIQHNEEQLLSEAADTPVDPNTLAASTEDESLESRGFRSDASAFDDTAEVDPEPFVPRPVARPRPVDISHPLAQEIILDPSRWSIWPAVAVLRWLLKRATRDARRIVYRSEPSLSFVPSEIHDVAVDSDGIELILNAPGIAAPGSPLPPSDIARIMADKRRGGAIASWLDGFGDRFMHVLETAQSRTNAAFALATGGQAKSLGLVGKLVGYSTPLTAYPEGKLSTERKDDTPEGAVGLASMYLGPVSARGLESLFQAFTGLPTQVKEFTGAEVPIARPTRVGGRLHMLLGTKCNQAEAGIEIVIEGGSDPQAQKWASDLHRRNSLRLLASSYIGSPSPQPSIFLLLNPDNTPSATLDGTATLGALAVLGKPLKPIFIPFIK